jgi:IS5 family transposase
MERKPHEPMLIDGMTAGLGSRRTMSQLARLDAAVPWETLARFIRPTYRNGGEQGGRPNVPVVMMLKIVMLQKWYNLSDPEMEEALLDRLSFRRFVGLGLTDANVDHATIAVFRGRLRQHGLMSVLFETVVNHLERQGLIVKEGTLVDATIIEAPRGRTREDKLGDSKDRAATYTKKHGRTYHGYKGHVATDTRAMIKDYVFDTACLHDSRHIDQLIAQEESQGAGGAVYADSAYMDKSRKARLESNGIFCGIIERRVRGQKELTDEQKQHNRRCAKVRAMVEHPFAWIKNTGALLRVRYRGLTRNAIDFGLNAIAYNFKRSLSLSK